MYIKFVTFECADSSTSDDTEPRLTRRATKRAAEQEEDKHSIKGRMVILQELLTDIRHHRDSWPFLSPVTKDEVPDYHDIISNPMDFGTIKCKLGNGEYKTVDQFFNDCRLIFENCRLYNKEHSSVYKYISNDLIMCLKQVRMPEITMLINIHIYAFCLLLTRTVYVFN